MVTALVVLLGSVVVYVAVALFVVNAPWWTKKRWRK